MTTTHPTVTPSVTRVTAGATLTVAIDNGPADSKDRVTFYSITAPGGSSLDWKYLNDERTAPATGRSAATVTLTAPSAPGRYVIRLLSHTDTTPLATSAAIVVSLPDAVPHRNEFPK